MPTRPTPPDCSHGSQQTYIELLALSPLLFALHGEQLFLVSANSDKTPHHIYLSLLYTSWSRGVVKRHNHFKIGINDLELPRYRSGKSKFIFADIQNLC